MSTNTEAVSVLSKTEIRTKTLSIVAFLKLLHVNVHSAIIENHPEYSTVEQKKHLSQVLYGLKADCNILKALETLQVKYENSGLVNKD
jgi:hypothetical protein